MVIHGIVGIGMRQRKMLVFREGSPKYTERQMNHDLLLAPVK